MLENLKRQNEEKQAIEMAEAEKRIDATKIEATDENVDIDDIWLSIINHQFIFLIQ